jgi:hypothetical protein
MSDIGRANSPIPVVPQRPRAWDFMETLLIALVADGVFFLASGLVLTIIMTAHAGAIAMSEAQLHALLTQGNWQGTALIGGSAPAIAVLWIAIRKARREFAEYLALNWPRPSELLYAFIVMAIVLVAEG